MLTKETLDEGGFQVKEEKLKILHLEDLHSDAVLISKAIKKGNINCEILVADTREKFLKALKEFLPDIILADHSLPSFNSVEALDIFKRSGLQIPFILITAAMSDEFAVDIIKKGADDYILKDRLHRLPTAIRNSLEKFRLEKERKIFLDELIKRENRYRALVENNADAVVILTAEGNPTYLSPSVKEVLGYSEKELKKIDLFTITHPDDAEELADKMKEVLSSPFITIKTHAAQIRHKNGSWRSIEATVTNLLHDPAVKGIVINFRDITQRKLAEERISHYNRLYAFISQINKTIVHSADEATVFKEACRIACEIGKYKVSWIGMFDFENKEVKLAEEYGIRDEDMPKFEMVSFENNEVFEHVIKSGNHYVCNNIPGQLAVQSCNALSANQGYGSSIVLPIKKSGTVVGTFNIYASELDFFTPEEIELLAEATRDISFSIDFFEKQRQKLRADEELKHKELRLNQAQAVAHLGSWELDFETGIAVWSDEMLRIHGLSQEEYRQSFHSWLAFIHPEDLRYVLKTTKEGRNTTGNSAFYHRIIKKDGTVRHIFSKAFTEFDNEGKAKGLHGVAHDVTEIKEAEEQVRKSESNLQAIFENTSEGFVLTDINGDIRSFNNKAQEIFFLNSGKEIAAGKSLFDFVGDSKRDMYKSILPKVALGEDMQYDIPFERENGQVKWFIFTITRVIRGGITDGFSVSAKDITERKEAENKVISTSVDLQNALTGLKRIMDSSLDVIITFDDQGRFVTASAASEFIWGYKPEELIGRKYIELVYEDDTKNTQQVNDDIRSGEPITMFENKYVHKDGRIVHMLWSSRWDDNDKLFYSIAKDVTEKKRLEKAIETERNQFFEMLLKAPSAIGMIKGANHVFEMVNPLYLQLIGKKNIVGKAMAEVLPEIIEQGFINILDTVYKSGKSYSGTEVLVKLDKEGKGELSDAYVNFFFQAYRNNEGDIEGVSFFINDITEQIISKQNLLITSERLLLATTSAKIGVWDWDISNDKMIWDERMRELYGVQEQPFEGAVSVWQNGVHPDDIERAGKELNDAIKGIRDFDTEFRVVWPDRSVHFIEAHAIVSKNEEGVGVRMIGTNIDITGRKKAEEKIVKLNEEVSKSEKLFKGVIENGNDMITMMNSAGKTIYASPSVQKKFGYTYEECLNLNIADVIHSDDALILQEFVIKLMMHPSVPMECPLLREIKKDGTCILVEGTLTNFLETEGVNAIVANFRDVTEHKKAEEENRFKANLLNTIGQATVATDINGLVNYWNKAAEKIYGWAQEEAIGKNIHDLTPSYATKEQAIEIMEELKQGRAWSGEFKVQRKDGTQFHAFVTDSPVFNKHHQLTGIIGISSDITEKKKLEDLLDRANNMALMGNYEIDLVRNTLYWSPTTFQIHEVENDFVPDITTAINFYKAGYSRECITRAVKEAIVNNTPFDVELEIITAKGNELWVRVIGEAECQDGICSRVYGSFQNINVRKRAEIDALRVSEEKNTILESIGDCFCAVDKNWHFTYWNKEAERVLQRKREDVLGFSIWEVYPETINTATWIHYHKAVEENAIQHFEIINKSINRWLEISAYPSVTGLSIYFRDVTERKHAEEALTQSEFKYRQIVETAQEGIWMLDKNSNTVFVNQKMCDMFGYSVEEMLGKPIRDFMDQEERVKSARRIKTRKEGVGEVNESRLITKDGKQVWVNMSANPFFDNAGNYSGSLAMITDITNRKEQEAQIQKNAEERELLIRELTKSLKDLKQFSFITSHNFRAPLSNLMGLLSLMDYDTLSEGNREIFEMLKTSTNQLNKTINDLIRILIIKNNVNVDITYNHIGLLLNEVCKSLAYQLNEARCTIHTSFEAEEIIFNQFYLESILMTLISNAIKYCSPKRPLEITFSTGYDTSGKVMLMVKDNGVGIDLKRHGDNIFGLYQRFHSATDGEGLGLFIAKSQITALGGSIEVTSEVDKGATFIITFQGKGLQQL